MNPGAERQVETRAGEAVRHGSDGQEGRRVGNGEDRGLRAPDRGDLPHIVLSAVLDSVRIDEGHAADRRFPFRQQDGLRLFAAFLPLLHVPVLGAHLGRCARSRGCGGLSSSGERTGFHQARRGAARGHGPDARGRALHQRRCRAADGRAAVRGNLRPAGPPPAICRVARTRRWGRAAPARRSVSPRRCRAV